MRRHADVHKALFKGSPAQVQKLAAQSRKEQRDRDRADFKRTEQEAGRWTEHTPPPNE